jgi:hypothetical protein
LQGVIARKQLAQRRLYALGRVALQWQIVGLPERAAAMPCTLRRAVPQALFLKLFTANR